MRKTKFKNLKLRQISASIIRKVLVEGDAIGQRLRNVREVLGMTQKQLAKRLKIKDVVISRIEKDALPSSIKTIAKIAKALECEFMGAIVSKAPLEGIIRRQAEKKAKKILSRTYANMAMEKQAPSNATYKYQLKKLVDELIAKPGPSLWEE